MKKLSLILALTMASSSIAGAAALNVPEINPQNGAVTVSGELGSELAGRRVTLFVKDAAGTINWFDTQKTNPAGEYSFEHQMVGVNNTGYTAYVTVENSSTSYSEPFTYFDASAESPRLWGLILGGKPTKDVSVIKSIIATRSDYLGLDLSVYNTLEDTQQNPIKSKVCESMYDAMSSISDFKPMLAEISKVWKLNTLGAVDEAQFKTEIAAIKGTDAQEADNIFAKLPIEKQVAIIDEMIATDYADKKSLINDYNKKIILAAANMASGWGEMKTLLQDAATTLGIDFSVYNTLTDQITPISNMIKQYTDISVITSTFNTEVSNQKRFELQNPPVPQGGGGGGGAGGGGIINNSNITLTPLNPEVTPEEAFYDIGEALWAKSSIELLKKNGIAAGDNGMYYPNNNITRAELVKMLMCTVTLAENDGRIFPFIDVGESDWFYGYIKNAYQNGIVSGISADSFYPYNNMTRQDMAVVIYNVLSKKAEVSGSVEHFVDSNEIAEYAKSAVGALSANNIISGFEDGTFRPREFATRAQVAVMLANVIKFLGSR